MIINKTKNSKTNAFTLVEVMIALIVTSIVLGAIAALSYAMTTAAATSQQDHENISTVRYTTVRVTDLIRNSKMICAKSANDIAIWMGDNNADNKINLNELCYLETGDNGQYVKLVIFNNNYNDVISLSNLAVVTTQTLLKYSFNYKTLELVKQCNNANIRLDAAPPRTNFLSLEFSLNENGLTQDYLIETKILCDADNLLSNDGKTLLGDDD
jgi:prepilin-type N-terminal cleavage/methylation domain-containing protein